VAAADNIGGGHEAGATPSRNRPGQVANKHSFRREPAKIFFKKS